MFKREKTTKIKFQTVDPLMCIFIKFTDLTPVFRTVSAGADKGIADKCFIRQRKPYQFADKYLSAQTKLRNCLMALLSADKLIN